MLSRVNERSEDAVGSSYSTVVNCYGRTTSDIGHQPSDRSSTGAYVDYKLVRRGDLVIKLLGMARRSRTSARLAVIVKSLRTASSVASRVRRAGSIPRYSRLCRRLDGDRSISSLVSEAASRIIATTLIR